MARSLRLAWPVFVIFLAQRLLTLAFVYAESGTLQSLALRWDAGWYLRLAEGGYVYPNLSPDGRFRPSNLAYFPLFPWLVRWTSGTGLLPVDQALIVVSWIGGLLAAWAIFAVGNAWFGRGAGIALAALWGMAPASLTLTMGYPEGWFTAAAAATLFCLIRRRPVWAGACAIVAGLLRPSAVAVIVMVGVYFLVEVGRWIAWRRSRRHDPPLRPDDTAETAEPDVISFGNTSRPLEGAPALAEADIDTTLLARIDPDAEIGPETQDAADPEPGPEPKPDAADRPRPGRAFLGAVISTLGLAGFMVYVGMRTGEVFGYFMVQGQWGQKPAASFGEYWIGVEQGLFGTQTVLLIPVTIAACMAYLLLFCLILFDRKLVWATVYAAGMLLISLTHVTFQHVYARQLLPAFVLLIPLVRMRVPRAGAVAALTVGSLLMSWGGAQFLLIAASGM